MRQREESMRVAVLMACHNRVVDTLGCLTALKNQKPAAVTLDLFLVDDGSTDGTAQAVRGMFPDATVIQGDGTLYWCGGMRLAFARALPRDYDFYLWLNDDTYLHNNALSRALHAYADASSKLGELLIMVGSTCARESGAATYGGWRQRAGRLGSISWEKIPPQTQHWITCDTMNGNCVLIPRVVVEKVGNLDAQFIQGLGDLDYGLRARQAGCQIVVAPGYYGDCSANEGAGSWTDERLPVLARWKLLLGPKGLPVKAWMIFSRRHKGRPWMLVWLSPYLMFWVNALLRFAGIKR